MGNNLSNTSINDSIDSLFNELTAPILPKQVPCCKCDEQVQILVNEFYRYTMNKNVIERCVVNNNKLQVLEAMPYTENHNFIPRNTNSIICCTCIKTNIQSNQNNHQNNYQAINSDSTNKQKDNFDDVIKKNSDLLNNISKISKNKGLSREEYTKTLQIISQISRNIDTYAQDNNMNLNINYKKYYCTICDSLWTGILNSSAAAFTKCDKYICNFCFRNYCCYEGCKNKAIQHCKLCRLGFCGNHTGHFNRIKRKKVGIDSYIDISCDISESEINYWKEEKGYVYKKQWYYERNCYI